MYPMENLNRLWYLALVACFGVFMSSCLAVQEKGGDTTSVNQSPKGEDLKTRPAPGGEEILVKFKPSVSEEQIQRLLKKYSMNLQEVIPEIDFYVLTIPGDRPAAELIEELQREEGVEAVETQGFMDILSNHPNQKETK